MLKTVNGGDMPKRITVLLEPAQFDEHIWKVLLQGRVQAEHKKAGPKCVSS